MHIDVQGFSKSDAEWFILFDKLLLRTSKIENVFYILSVYCSSVIYFYREYIQNIESRQEAFLWNKKGNRLLVKRIKMNEIYQMSAFSRIRKG